MHAGDLTTLLVQVILVLALSRAVGLLFSRMRQPQVIGEMVAGIMLGPSLLGWALPDVFATLFPLESLGYLNLLSQFGVIFFLFLIGLEFDPEIVRRRGRDAAVISVGSIALPFAVGVALTFLLYDRLFTDPARSHLWPSALFMGAAISVTAFPVLARILIERNLHKTTIGMLSLTGAAVNDVMAWCMLAFVVAVAQYDRNQGPASAVITASMAVLYVVFMLLVMKPFLERLQRVYELQNRLAQNLIAVIFLMVLASAYATEMIGIHALFGAFLMGCVMPKGSRFVRELSDKLEDFTVVFLLPIFFASAGLSTDLTRVFANNLWGYAALVTGAACVGKIGGAGLAARACGQPWRQSAAIGVLMNTRGLMELVILTIGLQLRVINESVYAIMVIMTLVTTAMTTPLLHMLHPHTSPTEAGRAAVAPAARRRFSILMPISDPESGVAMLRLARSLGGAADERRLLAVHLRRPEAREAYRAGLDDAPGARAPATLEPLLDQAREQEIEVEPISFVSRDVSADIVALSQARDVDLVLMGFHKPVFGHAMLGGTVHRVLTTAPTDVGIFVNRGVGRPKRIMVPYMGSAHGRLALELAARLAQATSAAVTVLHVVPSKSERSEPPLGARREVEKTFNEPGQSRPVLFKVVEHDAPVDAVLSEAPLSDLVVIGVAEEWGLESQVFGFRPQRIALECPTSLLIVRKYVPSAEI